MGLKDLKLSPKYKWYVLANVAVGTFMATLDGSIVNVALPTIAEKFRADLNLVQWVVSIYLLTISSLLLVFGRLADILGRSRIYANGFLVFILGSALCGISGNIYILIGSRVVQAAGAAMMMANGMALLTTIFPPQERGRALGLGGTVVALGSMTGPSLGGILVSAFGWPSIFLVNLPIGLIGFVASRVLLPNEKGTAHKEPFDWIGAIFFTIGMSLFLWGLTQGSETGWGNPEIVGAIVSSFVLLALFIFRELKTAYPLIDLNLFRERVFLTGNLSGLISFISMFSVTILMPFYLQRILSLTPAQTGLMMTAFPITMAVVAPISGWLSDRFGYLLLTTGGLLVNVLGLLLLSTISGSTPILFIAVYTSLMGIGMGLFQSPNNSSVMGAVPPRKLGIAGGVNALVRNVGMVTGIAFAISLFTFSMTQKGIAPADKALYAEAFRSSMALVFRSAAVIALLGVAVSFSRGKDKEKGPEPAKARG